MYPHKNMMIVGLVLQEHDVTELDNICHGDLLSPVM